MPAIDIEAKLAVNGTTPTDVGVSVYNKFAHTFYDTPKAFARDFANYVGAKRDMTEQEINELRTSIAARIAPETAESED